MEISKGRPHRVRRQYDTSLVKRRNKDAAAFVQYSRDTGVDSAKAWPYGHFQRFLAQLPDMKPFSLERMAALRRYYKRVVKSYFAQSSPDSALV